MSHEITDEAELEATFTRTEHVAIDKPSLDRSIVREHAIASLLLGRLRLDQRKLDDALVKLERAVRLLSVEENFQAELISAHLGAALCQAMTGFDELGRRHLHAAKRVLRKLPASEQHDELSEELATTTLRIKSLPAEAAPTENLGPEKRYRHSKFGEGALIGRRDTNLHIRFDDGTERWLVADRLTAVE